MGYVVVTMFQTDRDGFGGINIECYGPYKTITEAKAKAKQIEYDGITMIERLWEDKP